MTDMISYAPHGVVELSNLTATESGHIINLLVNDDAGIDNGSFVTFDIADSSVGYAPTGLGIDVLGTAKAPSTEDAVYLVASTPIIYESYTRMMQDESNFYNGKGEITRCLEVKRGDRFGLSKECFTNPDDIAVGKYVVLGGDSYKATVADGPGEGSFVGYIYWQATNGNYWVFVLKNGAGSASEGGFEVIFPEMSYTWWVPEGETIDPEFSVPVAAPEVVYNNLIVTSSRKSSDESIVYSDDHTVTVFEKEGSVTLTLGADPHEEEGIPGAEFTVTFNVYIKDLPIGESYFEGMGYFETNSELGECGYSDYYSVLRLGETANVLMPGHRRTAEAGGLIDEEVAVPLNVLKKVIIPEGAWRNPAGLLINGNSIKGTSPGEMSILGYYKDDMGSLSYIEISADPILVLDDIHENGYHWGNSHDSTAPLEYTVNVGKTVTCVWGLYNNDTPVELTGEEVMFFVVGKDQPEDSPFFNITGPSKWTDPWTYGFNLEGVNPGTGRVILHYYKDGNTADAVITIHVVEA